MARSPAFVLLALLVPLALPAEAAAAPEIRVSEVLADPASGSREFVELWNAGNTTVDLAGWKIKDASSNTFTFPTWPLSPNGRVVVWGGGAANAQGPVWSNSAVWNNAGDTVNVLRPDGSSTDTFVYGNAEHPAPAKGKSWSFEETWKVGEPTPGTIPGAQGGSLTITVVNKAPEVGFGVVPTALRPATTFRLAFTVDDPNGPADLASWRLLDGTATLAQGTTAGNHGTNVTAPSVAGPWSLKLEATDSAGLTGTVSLAINVQDTSLVLAMPTGGIIAFPELPPGGRALAQAPIMMQNIGSTPLHPVFDASAFNGPASFPAEGHLVLHLKQGGIESAVAYDAAMLRLPDIAPGATLEVTLEIVSLPSPLAAGVYGTSFAVVA